MKITPSTFIRELVAKAFPEYTGRKFRLEIGPHVTLWNTAWDGGSRSQYVAVDLVTGAVSRPKAEVVRAFPKSSRTPSVDIPVDKIVIEHTIFCGKDVGITIYVGSANVFKGPGVEGAVAFPVQDVTGKWTSLAIRRASL